MNDKPILFSGSMVRSILDGRKTMTRRVVSPQPMAHHWEGLSIHRFDVAVLDTTEGKCARFQHHLLGLNSEDPQFVRCPYGAELLWARETWVTSDNPMPGSLEIYYPNGPGISQNILVSGLSKATMEKYTNDRFSSRNRPSIHMPRWASRLTLKVTGVKVERLQDISEEDAKAEGVEPLPENSDNLANHLASTFGTRHKAAFSFLWDSINGKPRKNGQDISWDANPWVWVISFEPIHMNIDKYRSSIREAV